MISRSKNFFWIAESVADAATVIPNGANGSIKLPINPISRLFFIFSFAI